MQQSDSYYVVVPHRFGKSYLIIGDSIMLGCKRLATRFNSVKEAFNGACYLQDCNVFRNPLYYANYHIENGVGIVVKSRWE